MKNLHRVVKVNNRIGVALPLSNASMLWRAGHKLADNNAPLVWEDLEGMEHTTRNGECGRISKSEFDSLNLLTKQILSNKLK